MAEGDIMASSFPPSQHHMFISYRSRRRVSCTDAGDIKESRQNIAKSLCSHYVKSRMPMPFMER
jgi:hypothetical protein